MSNLRTDILNDRSTAGIGLRFATLLTAIFAFPLIWMGGLVTSHAAGMSVPDWPNSYGYNMFALPFGHWLGDYAGGAFYEHTHRLLGTLVGLAAFIATMCACGPSQGPTWRRRWGWGILIFTGLFVLTLVLALSLRSRGIISEEAYKHTTHSFSLLGMLSAVSLVNWLCRHRDPIRWRRWVVTSLLIAVSVQGLMGGFRVTEISLLLAKLHGIFGQMVFAFAAVVAVMCSRWWTTAHVPQVGVLADLCEERGTGNGLGVPPVSRSLDRPVAQRAGWLKSVAVIAVLLVSTQLVLGAFMRHDPRRDPASGGGAGLSIPDWPLHYGKILPPTNAAELAKVNEYRRWELTFASTTLGAIWLQFVHRMTAYLTGTFLIGTAVYVLRKHQHAKLVLPAALLGLLVIVQITLGILTVLWKKPADVATLHQAGGALLLMLASVLLVRAIRLYPFATRSAPLPATLPTDQSTLPVTATTAAVRR